MRRNTATYLLTLSGVLLAHNAFAATVSVRDCDGITRAVTEISDTQLATADVVFTKTSLVPSQISITNTDSGKSLTGTIANGKGTITGISAGSWDLCSDQQLTFDEVSLRAPRSSSYATTAGIAGIGAAIAVPLAIGSSGSSSGSSDGSVVATSNTSSSSSSARETAPAGGTNLVDSDIPAKCKTATGRRASASSDDCRNEESPPPLSPFR